MIYDVEVWSNYDELMNDNHCGNSVRFESLNEREVSAMLVMLHRSQLVAVVIPRMVGFENG